MSELPFHPTIPGLQAIGLGRRGPIWPIMGGSQPLGEPPAGDPPASPAPTDPPATDPQPDRGFPENTPIAEMNAEQQAAYWKFHDRRKSDTLKAYGGVTPEQVQALQARNAELEREQLSAADKALADAREEATAAATAAAATVWAPEVAKAVVGQFITDQKQRDAVLAGINPMAFMKDGKFDTDALIGHLTGLSAAFGGNGSGGTEPRQWGQGGTTPPAKSGRDEGLAEAKRRGYIKD
ncbi:hypothetical protein [Mycolicibacterium fortuitum]|uniref:hypothetical protein n=1 Tax=Mycolicibacterium fortuitum TaxID=1766 RepID=UPI001131F0A3|nr:hypothetical protein [Mycolicibacterium fortuitum]TPW93662.1 hypothetical protein FKW78_18555 [Mycolicibacterium fortuitum]